MIPPVRLNGSPKPAIIESPQNKIERGESHGQDMEYLVLANWTGTRRIRYFSHLLLHDAACTTRHRYIIISSVGVILTSARMQPAIIRITSKWLPAHQKIATVTSIYQEMRCIHRKVHRAFGVHSLHCGVYSSILQKTVVIPYTGLQACHSPSGASQGVSAAYSHCALHQGSHFQISR